VTSSPESLADSVGVVVPGFERGAVILRDQSRQVFRLSWEEKDSAGGDRRRALPAGTYTLAGYRLIREDEHGKTWHLSATAPAGRAIEVVAGVETQIDLDPTIRIRKHIQGKKLQVQIRGEGKMGLSIYSEGKRVPIAFELKDARGRAVESGKIEYG